MEEPSLPPDDTTEVLATKGFIGSLLDFSFESFVTPRLVKFLYVLALVTIAVNIVFWLLKSFDGIIWRIALSPVIFVVGAILSRVAIEVMMVAFRILELLRKLDAERRNGGPKV